MHYCITDHIKDKYFDELKEYCPYIRQVMLFRHMTKEVSKNLLQFRSMCTIIVMMIFRIMNFWRIQDDRR